MQLRRGHYREDSQSPRDPQLLLLWAMTGDYFCFQGFSTMKADLVHIMLGSIRYLDSEPMASETDCRSVEYLNFEDWDVRINRLRIRRWTW